MRASARAMNQWALLDRVAHVRHGHWHRNRHARITGAPAHEASLRFSARRSRHSRRSRSERATSLSSLRCDLLGRRQRQRADRRRRSPGPYSRRVAERHRARSSSARRARSSIASLRNDAGEHLIAAQFVGHRGDRGGAHLRVLRQHRLHLDGGDVLAAAPDDVLAAVDETHDARRIARHQVAGVEPAAAPGRLRRRRRP